MLKRTDDPGASGAAGGGERGIGDIVGQLTDEAKAYARAEMNLAKAIALARANALRLPVILFAAAFLFLQAAVVAFAVGVLAALAPRTGPILGGIIAMLLFAAIAAALGWYGARRLREDR